MRGSGEAETSGCERKYRDGSGRARQILGFSLHGSFPAQPESQLVFDVRTSCESIAQACILEAYAGSWEETSKFPVKSSDYCLGESAELEAGKPSRDEEEEEDMASYARNINAADGGDHDLLPAPTPAPAPFARMISDPHM